MRIFEIDGFGLTAAQIKEIMRTPDAQVRLSNEAKQRCRESRKQIDKWLEKDAPVIYGVNTGLGNLKDVVVPPDMHIEWNRSLPYPHAAGMGAYLPPETTRLALLLRANILARAYSAVRVELIERMLDLFNKGVCPAVHSEGSTGLSDLAPMAQCVMAVAGLQDAMAYYKGQLLPAREALNAAGLCDHFDLECKEVLAQMNGSTMTQAIGELAYIRYQDVYEKYLRAVGNEFAVKRSAYEKTAAFVLGILDLENNISCDNPLLFRTEDGTYEAVMGCNCSNTQVGYGFDLMSVIVCELGNDLCCGNTNPEKEALLVRLRTCTMQISADSIPTKSGQEDHVEFSFGAARKFSLAVELLDQIIAKS